MGRSGLVDKVRCIKLGNAIDPDLLRGCAESKGMAIPKHDVCSNSESMSEKQGVEYALTGIITYTYISALFPGIYVQRANLL